MEGCKRSEEKVTKEDLLSDKFWSGPVPCFEEIYKRIQNKSAWRRWHRCQGLTALRNDDIERQKERLTVRKDLEQLYSAPLTPLCESYRKICLKQIADEIAQIQEESTRTDDQSPNLSSRETGRNLAGESDEKEGSVTIPNDHEKSKSKKKTKRLKVDTTKTFALRLILPIVSRTRKRFPSLRTGITFGGEGIFRDTSCYLNFLDLDYELSIQTHTEKCGHGLCETALLSKSKECVVYHPEFDYGDVLRHDSTKKFQKHLVFLFKKLIINKEKTAQTIDDS
jgi:hypothetical protein